MNLSIVQSRLNNLSLGKNKQKVHFRKFQHLHLKGLHLFKKQLYACNLDFQTVKSIKSITFIEYNLYLASNQLY